MFYIMLIPMIKLWDVVYIIFALPVMYSKGMFDRTV